MNSNNKDTILNALEQGILVHFLKGQTRILEYVLSKKSLSDILSAIIEEFEKYLHLGYCSVYLLDEKTQTLKILTAPSVPRGFQEAVKEIKVGPTVGSCGTAAYRKELVIVSDIQNSPLWLEYKDVAKQHNLAAAWAKPIFGGHDHRLLGAFGIYYPTIKEPEPYIIELLDAYAYIAGIAIENVLNDRQLKKSQAQYQLITENMSEFIFIINSKDEMEYVSPSHEMVFGFMPPSLKELTQHVHPDDLDLFQKTIAQLREGLEQAQCQFRMNKPNGSWVYLEMDLKLFQADKFLSVCHDITDQKHYENQLKRIAFYDALTGLPNRYFFMEQLKEEILRARENTESFALLYLDCDDFKQINDTLGHDAGDLFLQEFAKRAQEIIHIDSTFARMGGDEFILLLPNMENEEVVAAVAEQILSVLAKPWNIHKQEFILSVSMGISLFPQDGLTANSLIKHADYSMAFAKKHGKNQFQFYNPSMNHRVYNQTKLKKDLYLALERNELSVHYQPIVHMESGTIKGTEALLRWNHPQYGVISPLEFIALAEETGLIVQIGESVLTQACRQLKKWHEAGYDTLIMSVNLSPIQIEQYHFVEKILQLLHDLDLSPEFLSLEITESIFIEETAHTRDTLERLQSHNISISFDDFGTGYSSLSYLKNFPVNIIKIDQSFIHDLTLSKHDIAIVDTIIKICATLELLTVAEGVETAEHALKLKELGCTFLQGYYFSKPCLPDELEQKFPIIIQMLADLNTRPITSDES